MWKAVLADYIHALQPNNVWKKLKNTSDSRWINCITLPAIWMWAVNSEEGASFQHYFVYISFMTLACLGILLSHVCDNRLNDAMFLCPMSRRERKQYIKCGYRIRIGMIFIPYSLGCLILCVMGYMDWISLLIFAAIMLLYLLGINSYRPGRGEGMQLWFTISGYLEFILYYVIYQEGGLRGPGGDIGIWICIVLFGSIALFYLGQLIWRTRVEYVKMVMECMDFR